MGSPVVKRLVVFADGTWKSERDVDRSNVWKLSQAVDPSPPSGVPQLLEYDDGVGTGSFLDRILGGAFGKGLSENVQELYRFLIRVYSPGDRLYFFGFSRGAYTVRSLAGLVRQCGILRQDSQATVDDAYELYRDRDPSTHPAGERARRFRDQHSHRPDPRVHFVGVWDTVGSLGVPTRGPIGWYTRRKYGFHDVRLSSHVAHGYHALAVDEKRKPFAPTLWSVREEDAPDDARRQTIEQRWFPGVHSNIGGGYAECGLSDLALLWMMDRAEDAGLELRSGCREGLRCNHGDVLHESMNWLYARFGRYQRPIDRLNRDARTGGRVVSYQDVDRSVVDRHLLPDLKPRYAPPNFVDYWRRNPEKWLPERPPAR